MTISYTQSSGLDANQLEMVRLAQAHPENHLHTADLPYRLSSWGLDDPENTRLWYDPGGRLAGWAVLQTPFWTFDFACLPEAEESLFPEMLAWADHHAQQTCSTPGGHPSWYVDVFAGQAGMIRALKAAGFADQSDAGENSWSKVLMQRPAQEPVKEFRLPAGFTVRPLNGIREVEAYVALHQEVFGTKNMTVEWRRRTLLHPDYIPDLDLVVEAPDGRLEAFCIGWLDRKPGHLPVGQIEPLGCHPDFRRFALGRIALAEALRRLASCGAEHIRVETDNYRDTALALYESLGFRLVQDVLVFRKDYRINL
jgi:ribosomal protein S18 acetylase RimI-like enzyme